VPVRLTTPTMELPTDQLPPGITYTYRCRAVYAGSEGIWSHHGTAAKRFA
jgi:hypothetical protein